MKNTVYLEVFQNQSSDSKSNVQLSLESLITYCLYEYLSPKEVDLVLVSSIDDNETKFTVKIPQDMTYLKKELAPWQVASCIYPVVLHEDTIITGLCAVARHISIYATTRLPEEHEHGLLGFRKSCLQAPNEVSIWTKFCEVDITRTVKHACSLTSVDEIPINLVRFENHLSKPVRVHNVFKLARDMKKLTLKFATNSAGSKSLKESNNCQDIRSPKSRKWKSNTKKDLDIDSSMKIEDLPICHQFAEGPFLTLADIILYPLYHILIQIFQEDTFKTYLPLSYKWFTTVKELSAIKTITELIESMKINSLQIKNITLPSTDNVSLYKCDPKRHNPKKRLFTKEYDIEGALNQIKLGVELQLTTNNEIEKSQIDWNEIPDGANPSAGHLPDVRMARKKQQLENLALSVMNIAKEGDLIVDFCSGSGHLGILIAHLLPKCTVILLENKEQSLMRARKRVHEMGLTNVYFFQCNLDFYIGKFDIGVALHACGIASDLVLDKCLKANAKFVLCPCCYGSLHATDRLRYPRSKMFSNLNVDQYMCIGHAADQTHNDHPLTVRGARCMAVIDSDRARLAQEQCYTVSLSRLKPLSCTPKNNLLVGIPA